MKNFGLTRESHYKSKINWTRKLIDVDLSLEDYDSNEGINSSYLLLDILVKNSERLAEKYWKIQKICIKKYMMDTLNIRQKWHRTGGFDDDVLSYLDRFLDKESAEKMKNGELTEKAYRKMIYLTDISVDFEETLSVIAYDGEWIFGGHYIYLEGNIEGEFNYGDI